MNKNSATAPVIDWADWLRRWDAMQTGYLPYREQRFTAMLDVLAELLPPDFVAVDLCCGPGSLSQRLLNRFPQARCIAVDFDPLLLTMGQAVLGDAGGRLRWVEVDVEDGTALAAALAGEQVDTVLSTTALHWFTVEKLVLIYRQIGQLVRPGGVFLNGDNISFAPHLGAFRQVAAAIKEHDKKSAFTEQRVEDWDAWWAAVAHIPGITPLLSERERRFSGRPRGFDAPIIDVHIAALRDAGFHQVDVIWRRFDDCVLMAVK
ncbi:MAG: class I SAM-dependent methyltransferase [Anaerolineae bacterium]|nr:class I SAM-dependent methyltransferase [Anaerolineae bacterium]MDW8070345.1 class I SAM-dependent methyltransferase [Anaerolineae bacterium]